jgi:hypothetical protein
MTTSSSGSINTKKRVVAEREVLASDEEEDVRAMEKIEEILCTIYERKKRGPRTVGEYNHPFHINVSVEPINPCVTNTPKKTPSFRQSKFGGSLTTGSLSTQGTTTGGASSGNISQVSTPHRGDSSSVFRMAGHDPTIILPKFQGEATEEPEKNLFICAKIWEEKQITDDNTKLTQLGITLRDCTLDQYMSLDTNNAPGMTMLVV